MIICLCRGVSDKDVRRAVGRGAGAVEAISAACGAGSDCGACTLMLVDLLMESEAAGVGDGIRS